MPEQQVGRIRFALFAQHVVDNGGLLSMLNGAWTRIELAEMPGAALVTVAAQAEGVPTHAVIMSELVDPDGEVLASTSSLVTGSPTDDGLSPTTLPMVLVLPVMISKPGRHVVRFSGAVDPHEIDFWVIKSR